MTFAKLRAAVGAYEPGVKMPKGHRRNAQKQSKKADLVRHDGCSAPGCSGDHCSIWIQFEF